MSAKPVQVRNEANKIKFLTAINGFYSAPIGDNNLATLSSVFCNF